MSNAQNISGFNLSGLGGGGYSGYHTKITRISKTDTVNKGLSSWTPSASKTGNYDDVRTPSASVQTASDCATPPSGKSSGNKIYGIDLVRLREMLVELKPYASDQVDELDSNLRGNISALRHIAQNLHENGQTTQLSQVVELFREYFNPDTITTAGTVGAVISGCQTSGCHGIPGGCGHLCGGSIMGDPSLTGTSPCEDAVVHVKNGVVSLKVHGKLGNKKSYVYVTKEFSGYTSTIIKNLRMNGIEQVKTVVTEGAKCIQTAAEFVSLDDIEKQLIKSQSKPQSMTSLVKEKNDTPTYGGLDDWRWWILISVGIVLVVLIVIWAVMRYGVNKNVEIVMPESTLEKALERSSMGGGIVAPGNPDYTEGFFTSLVASMTPRI
jgi:hypothetical protein